MEPIKAQFVLNENGVKHLIRNYIGQGMDKETAEAAVALSPNLLNDFDNLLTHALKLAAVTLSPEQFDQYCYILSREIDLCVQIRFAD